MLYLQQGKEAGNDMSTFNGTAHRKHNNTDPKMRGDKRKRVCTTKMKLVKRSHYTHHHVLNLPQQKHSEDSDDSTGSNSSSDRKVSTECSENHELSVANS